MPRATESSEPGFQATQSPEKHQASERWKDESPAFSALLSSLHLTWPAVAPEGLACQILRCRWSFSHSKLLPVGQAAEALWSCLLTRFFWESGWRAILLPPATTIPVSGGDAKMEFSDCCQQEPHKEEVPVDRGRKKPHPGWGGILTCLFPLPAF